MKFLIFSLLAVALAGCAAEQRSDVASTQQHAECLVCKENVDLACVDVAVDATTPRYAYEGKTYYFCSDECRDKFAKDPAKYAK
jgi:YHS domain-containing protein